MLGRRLLGLSRGLRARIGLLVLLGMAITATYVGQGLLIAWLIARILEGRPVSDQLVAILGVVVLQGVRVLVVWWREEQAMRLAGDVKERVRAMLYERLLWLGPGYLTETRTGSITSTMVDGVEALERYFAGFVPQLFASIIGAAVIVLAILALDPVVGIVVLVCTAAVALAPAISRRLLRDTSAGWWRDYRDVYTENLDAIQGMSTLKAFGAADERGRRLDSKARRFADASVHLTLASVAFTGIVGLAESAGIALSVGIGALRLADGALTAPVLLAILLLVRECFRPLHDLQAAFHGAYGVVATSQGIFEVLDAPPVFVPRSPVASLAAIPDLPGPPEIVFRDVTFRYGPDRQPALDKVSLRVAPGERVALVGRSGAGKTTVVSLLLRWFAPGSGTITIDGVDVDALGPDEVRSRIALVAQDTYLFHGSVRANLLLGRPGASDAEIAAAAAAADAHDFISRLPSGYDTVIGERGLRLSGGERQRLSIARALLKDAPILILDEATSSVDAASEAAIGRAIDRLVVGRTTLVIAHRLSTIRTADRIVVLDRGRVVETGDHERLVAARGTYAALVDAQGPAA